MIYGDIKMEYVSLRQMKNKLKDEFIDKITMKDVEMDIKASLFVLEKRIKGDEDQIREFINHLYSQISKYNANTDGKNPPKAISDPDVAAALFNLSNPKNDMTTSKLMLILSEELKNNRNFMNQLFNSAITNEKDFDKKLRKSEIVAMRTGDQLAANEAYWINNLAALQESGLEMYAKDSLKYMDEDLKADKMAMRYMLKQNPYILPVVSGENLKDPVFVARIVHDNDLYVRDSRLYSVIGASTLVEVKDIMKEGEVLTEEQDSLIASAISTLTKPKTQTARQERTVKRMSASIVSQQPRRGSGVIKSPDGRTYTRGHVGDPAHERH